MTDYGPLFSGGVFTHSFLGPIAGTRLSLAVSSRRSFLGSATSRLSFRRWGGGAQPRLTMHRKRRPMADENPPLFRPGPSRRTGSLRT